MSVNDITNSMVFVFLGTYGKPIRLVDEESTDICSNFSIISFISCVSQISEVKSRSTVAP